MDGMEPLQFASSLPPLDRLDPAGLDLLERTLEGVYFPAGTRILQQDGAPSSHVYILRKGSVRLVREGRELAIVEEGEYFGHPSVLSGDRPTSDVIADEDVLAYRIPKDTFMQLTTRSAIAEFFLESLVDRLRRTADANVSPLRVDFASPVDSLVTRPPLFVEPGDTVRQAAALMRDAQASSVLVSGDPQGIITDRDLRSRVIANGISADTPVNAVMTQPLKSLSADEPLYGVLLFMLEESIHHVPLTRDGRVVGIVTDTDLLRHEGRSPLYLLKRVQKIGGKAEAFNYANEIAALAETSLLGGLNVGQIGRVIASLNDALANRLIRIAEQELGPPPSGYAWIVFGSEGRREQVLLTDQDNALIFEDDNESARAYFTELARRVVDGLLAAGFPPCPGGFTADRLVWSLAECHGKFASWLATPQPEALLDSSVLFDFRALHQTVSLRSLEELVITAKDNQLFMAHLARQTLRFKPPLSSFRRIKTSDGDIEIKKGGITPIVGLARLYGIMAASSARSTTERLDAAGRARVLSEETAETMSEAFLFMLRLRLDQQLASLRSGNEPSSRIDLDAISPLERRHLKEGLVFVRDIQEAAAQRFDTARLA
jgi:CBS domain-containing protein